MPKFVSSAAWVRWGIAVVALFATPRLAGAACSGVGGPDFGQLLPNCGGAYCYVVSPGQHTPLSLAGSFWTFGAGDPVPGHGNDNGTWPVTSWLLSSGSNLYINGGWQASPAIDGCISGTIAPGKPAEIMVALISDDAASGGVFAVAAARRVMAASPEFDFTFVGGGGVAHDIDLVEIPKARVASFTRPNTFEFTSPDLSQVSAGIYADGSVTPGELAKGYRVYTRPTSSSNHSTSAWTSVSGVVPLGQNVSIAVPWQYEVHFAYALVFDGGFETAYVGRDVRAISTPRCEVPPSDDDADGYYFWNDPSCAPDSSQIDCNDANGAVHPGAIELCNGIDDNCDNVIDNVSLPGPVASLRLTRVPGAARLAWPPLPVAVSYDVVRGDLTELSNSAGNFSSATKSCLANDVTATQVDDPEDPDPAYGFWYLLRAGNCAGLGSFDDADPSQAAARDAGIEASGHACP